MAYSPIIGLRLPFWEPETPAEHHSNIVVLDVWARQITNGQSIARASASQSGQNIASSTTTAIVWQTIDYNVPSSNSAYWVSINSSRFTCKTPDTAGVYRATFTVTYTTANATGSRIMYLQATGANNVYNGLARGRIETQADTEPGRGYSMTTTWDFPMNQSDYIQGFVIHNGGASLPVDAQMQITRIGQL